MCGQQGNGRCFHKNKQVVLVEGGKRNKKNEKKFQEL
jgi:hypothetical protein